MPPTETVVFDNQLLTNWLKEQFSKEFCNSEDFWTNSGTAGQKCFYGRLNAFISVRMTLKAKQGNHWTV